MEAVNKVFVEISVEERDLSLGNRNWNSFMLTHTSAKYHILANVLFW